MSEIEIWKDIEGYEGLYQVSNMGMVKSLNYKCSGKEKILKPSKNIYMRLVLRKDGKGKCVLVHRLVASAFIPNDNPTEKTEIKHIDENPSNNHFLNLEWCSHIENLNYGTRNKKISDSKKEYFKDKENHPMYGKHHSEEAKQKISQAIKGKHRSEETKQKISQALKGKYVGENHWGYGRKRGVEFISKISKPILQYTKDMVFIREWDSARQVEKELNINHSHISKCCQGKQKTCGGFIWRYKDIV